MNKFEMLKIKRECKKTGRMQEYREYLSYAETVKSDIVRYSKYVEDYTKKFEEVKINYSEDSKEYIDARDEANRWKQVLDDRIGQLRFIRPNSQEDINYRNSQCNNFVQELKQVLSPNFDLRFHGTPIYFAEQIIKNGGIFSTADRYDSYIKSTDLKGQISASTAKTIARTIDVFSDTMAYQRCLPCGCIFAVKPRNKEDANLRK